MKKQLCFLTASLFLLLLSACGGEPAGTWTPVEDFQFTLEEAAGVDGTSFTPDGFDPARINDPEAIKNLVQSGLGVSFVSERAARSAVEEKRLLQFELPVESRRYLYLAHRRDYILQPHIKAFCRFVEAGKK